MEGHREGSDLLYNIIIIWSRGRSPTNEVPEGPRVQVSNSLPYFLQGQRHNGRLIRGQCSLFIPRQMGQIVKLTSFSSSRAQGK